MTWRNSVLYTGFEAKGKCSWCGGNLPKCRRCYCSNNHQNQYLRHFHWREAVFYAFDRAQGKCQDCGKPISSRWNSDNPAEVHHIQPLKGDRNWNILNRPENLKVVCRECHGKYRRKNKLAEPLQGLTARDVAAAQGSLLK